MAALTTKRDELLERFADAVDLKSGIDRRRSRLNAALRDIISDVEVAELHRPVDSMCRLRLDSQWVDDRVDISHRQLSALMENILSLSQATEC